MEAVGTFGRGLFRTNGIGWAVAGNGERDSLLAFGKRGGNFAKVELKFSSWRMCIIQRRWGKEKGEPFLPQSPRTYLTCQRKKYRRIRTGEREREGRLRKASINLGLPRSSLRHRKTKRKRGSSLQLQYKAMDFLLL